MYSKIDVTFCLQGSVQLLTLMTFCEFQIFTFMNSHVELTWPILLYNSITASVTRTLWITIELLKKSVIQTQSQHQFKGFKKSTKKWALYILTGKYRDKIPGSCREAGECNY